MWALRYSQKLSKVYLVLENSRIVILNGCRVRVASRVRSTISTFSKPYHCLNETHNPKSVLQSTNLIYWKLAYLLVRFARVQWELIKKCMNILMIALLCIFTRRIPWSILNMSMRAMVNLRLCEGSRILIQLSSSQKPTLVDRKPNTPKATKVYG